MTHPAPTRHAMSLPALWFGLFAAPVVWSLQLLTLYPAVAHGCYPRDRPLSMPVTASLSTLTLAATVVALAVALVGGAVALGSWRAAQADGDPSHLHMLEVGEGRSRFMALGGILLSVLFLFGIVMNAIPLLLLGPCG